jgi:predicted small secreted protein
MRTTSCTRRTPAAALVSVTALVLAACANTDTEVADAGDDAGAELVGTPGSSTGADPAIDGVPERGSPSDRLAGSGHRTGQGSSG